MVRLGTILAVLTLLAACSVDKPVPEASGDDPSTGGADDDDDDPGASQTQAGFDGSGGAESSTGALEGGSTGDTCTFVCGTTEGSEEGGGDCDNWTQDCPDGEKCSAWANDGGSSWNSVKCVPVEPNAAAPGEACTAEGGGVSGFDSCQKGAMCWDIDPDTGKGVCVELCTGSPESPQCADAGTSCTIANDGVLNLCLPKCDPLLQDCPGEGDVCIPNPQNADAFICVFDASGETGKTFDVCEYANACDPGFLCATPNLASECDPQANGCCLPFCDVQAPDCPGVGQECLPWYEADTAPPGYENVGLCGLPMG